MGDAFIVRRGTVDTSVPIGTEALPINDVGVWQKCAGLRAVYTTVEDVLQDSSYTTTLLHTKNALEYMVRSVLIQRAVLASETAVNLLRNSIHLSNPIPFISSGAYGVIIGSGNGYDTGGGVYLMSNAFNGSSSIWTNIMGASFFNPAYIGIDVSAATQTNTEFWPFEVTLNLSVTSAAIPLKIQGKQGQNWVDLTPDIYNTQQSANNTYICTSGISGKVSAIRLIQSASSNALIYCSNFIYRGI